jgi:hypothetical protein
MKLLQEICTNNEVLNFHTPSNILWPYYVNGYVDVVSVIICLLTQWFPCNNFCLLTTGFDRQIDYATTTLLSVV